MSFVGGVRSISRRCVVTPERAPSCKHQGVGRVGPWLAVTGLRRRLGLRIRVRVGCGLSSLGAVGAPAAAGRGLPAARRRRRRFGGGVGVRRRGRRRGRRRKRHPPAPAAPLLLWLCARPPARCDVVHEGAAGARKCCCMVPRRRPQARRAFPGASPGQQWDAPRALQARPLAPHAPEHRRGGGAAPRPGPAAPPPPPPHPPSDVGRSRRPAGPRAWLQRQRGRWLRRRRCILGLLRGQARLAARVPRGPAARARLAQQRRAGAPARLKRAQLGGRAACAARGPGAWRRAPAIARRRGALAPPGHTHARRPVAISCCGRLCCIKTVRAVALGRQGACARSQAPNHRLCPTGQAQGRVRAWQLGRRQEGKLERGLHARHALLAVPRLQLQPHLPRPRPARRRRSPPEPAGISRSLYRLTTSQAEAIASAQGWAATDAPRVPAAGRGRAARRAAAARARPPCERRQGRRPVERASQRGGRAAGAHRVGQQAHPVALRLRHNGCWRALPLAPRLLPRQRLPAQPQGALRGPAETSDPAGQAAARLPAPPSRCNRTGAPALRNPTRAAQGSQACAGVARQGAQSRQPAATGQRTPSQGRFARQGGAGLARGGRAPAARPHSPGAARRPPPRRRRRRTAARPGTRATGARCRHGASARAASAPAPARAQSSSFQYVCKV